MAARRIFNRLALVLLLVGAAQPIAAGPSAPRELPPVEGGMKSPPTEPLAVNDGDGMPDEWERQNGLDPDNAHDRNEIGDGGYTNLEIYLNSIGEEQAR